jgi:hypothetical protein
MDNCGHDYMSVALSENVLSYLIAIAQLLADALEAVQSESPPVIYPLKY